MKPRTSKGDVGIKHGFRSGLEGVQGEYLRQKGVDYEYETLPIPFTQPVKMRRYTPDFILPNGIIVETKGRFVTADRQKMILIKKQYPELDIRFVFTRSKTPINKGSKTTYGMWCKKHGYPYADGLTPSSWLEEDPNEASLAAIKAIRNGTT